MIYTTYQLPVDFKIPEGVDAEKFAEKIYNKIVDMAEEENIEITSDNMIMYIDKECEDDEY